MSKFNNAFSIDKKLQAMSPFIDMALFNQDIDYRRKVVSAFKQQEQQLQQLRDEYTETNDSNYSDDYDCVLGYN